jgi:hypothetical protein
MVRQAHKKRSEAYKKAHKSLIQAFDNLQKVTNRAETERLLDELATVEREARRRHPGLSDYTPKILDDLEDDNDEETGLTQFQTKIDPWAALQVFYPSSYINHI